MSDSVLNQLNISGCLQWSVEISVFASADILKEFNPSLTGFSVGIGNENSPKAFLNQAVAGAKSGSVFTFWSLIFKTLVELRSHQNKHYQNITIKSCFVFAAIWNNRCASWWPKWKVIRWGGSELRHTSCPIVSTFISVLCSQLPNSQKISCWYPLTAHWFLQRLESDHDVYWWQWHMWLLHRQREHSYCFFIKIIAITSFVP